jgi:PAS domain-containing protein
MANATQTGTMEIEYRYLHPRKGLRWFLCKGRRFSEDARDPTMFGIIMDITERKQAADTLRLSEEQFRALADSIPQLVWMAEPDGYIFWYNERWNKYTGTKPEQVAGWKWESVHDPEHLPQVIERWRHCLATG